MGWVESAALATYKLLPNPRKISLETGKGKFQINDARRRPVRNDELQFFANAGLLGNGTTFLMTYLSTAQVPETNNTITETDGTVWSILNVAWEIEGVIRRCVCVGQR